MPSIERFCLLQTWCRIHKTLSYLILVSVQNNAATCAARTAAACAARTAAACCVTAAACAARTAALCGPNTCSA